MNIFALNKLALLSIKALYELLRYKDPGKDCDKFINVYEKTFGSSQEQQESQQTADAESTVAKRKNAIAPEKVAETKVSLSWLNPDDEVFIRFTHDLISSLNGDEKTEILSLFNVDSTAKTLIQCGNFQNIATLWQKLRTKILDGKACGRESEIALSFLKIYNFAAKEGSTATEYIPVPGSNYNSAQQQRFQSDGVRVKAVIFPGLYRPNGQLLHKALVQVA